MFRELELQVGTFYHHNCCLNLCLIPLNGVVLLSGAELLFECRFDGNDECGLEPSTIDQFDWGVVQASATSAPSPQQDASQNADGMSHRFIVMYLGSEFDFSVT